MRVRRSNASRIAVEDVEVIASGFPNLIDFARDLDNGLSRGSSCEPNQAPAHGYLPNTGGLYSKCKLTAV